MSQKLVKSTSIFAGMTLISRVLGFAREMILAQIFGAGMVFDAFVIAFRIPNFMRTLFGEGAFSQAFVPVLATYREQKSPQELKQFINHVAGNMTAVLLGLVLIGELLAPFIILGFAPGFAHDPVRLELARHLLYITLPYIFFISLVALSGGILNTFSRFGVSSFTPVILNVVMILCAWFLAPRLEQPIMGLAWGVFLAGLMQLLMQIPYLKKLGLLPRPQLNWQDPGVKRILKLMVPAIFGASVAQISLLIDNFFASYLPVGSISWLYYSDRLIYLPVGVIGVALGTVVLPHLSRHHARQMTENFSKTLDWGLRCVLIGAIPPAVGLWCLSAPILTTLMRHGEFNNFDVIMTAKSLMAFAVGLPAMMAVKVLASAFYSRQDIKTPVKVAALVLIIGVGLNLVLIKPLAHAGLALATSLTTSLNALLLLIILLKLKVYKPNAAWLSFGLRILLATAAMVGVLYYLRGTTHQWLARELLANIGHLIFLIVLGALTYFASLFLSGMRLRHLAPPKD